MKVRGKELLFILAILLIASLFLNISNSFALTLTGPDEVIRGSSAQYTVSDCSGTV